MLSETIPVLRVVLHVTVYRSRSSDYTCILKSRSQSQSSMLPWALTATLKGIVSAPCPCPFIFSIICCRGSHVTLDHLPYTTRLEGQGPTEMGGQLVSMSILFDRAHSILQTCFELMSTCRTHRLAKLAAWLYVSNAFRARHIQKHLTLLRCSISQVAVIDAVIHNLPTQTTGSRAKTICS